MMDMTQSMCDIIYDICGYDKNTIHAVAASPLNHKDIQLVVHLFCY